MASHLTTAWWKYNPILQKPTTLEPVQPWSWFWYYGPDPAAGCSYGQYHDEDNVFDVIHEVKDEVFSPASGKPMKMVCGLSYDEVKSHLDKVIGTMSSWSGTCSSCQACLTASVSLSEANEVYCSLCGGDVKANLSAKGKTMDKIKELKNQIRSSYLKRKEATASSDVVARREKIKAAVKARLVAKAAATASSEEWVPLSVVIAKANRVKAIRAKAAAEKANAAKAAASSEEWVPLSVVVAKANRIKAIRAKKAAAAKAYKIKEIQANRAKKAKADNDEFVSLDEILEAMNVEADGENALERAADNLEEAAKNLKEHAAEESMEPEHGGDDLGGDDLDDLGGDEAGEADEAGEPSEGGDEEYMDLDMVVSMLNKREMHARRRRLQEVAAKLKSKRRSARADASVDELFDGIKPEEMPTMEAEENPAVEDVPAADLKDAEAMRFEPLASASSFSKIKKEDIDMTLYSERGENPTWNVTVAGVPVASISLKAQASAEDIRSVFCSDDYALDLIEHCVKSGFVPTMNKVSAKFWANHLSDSKIEARFVAKAEASFAADRRALQAAFRNELTACLNIVTAGINKNYYPALGNPLKDHLFANLTMVGLPEQTAISAIEKSFQEGSSGYFAALFDKASEYMDMPKQVRAEIASAIGASNYLDAYSNNPAQTGHATLADRVAQASVIPAANGGGNSLNVTALRINEADFKSQLKSVWKKN